MKQTFKVLQEAFADFAWKLEIYDPLEREIMNEDSENQALERDELLEEIGDLSPLVGSSLNVPLNEQMMEDLNNLIEGAENAVINLA